MTGSEPSHEFLSGKPPLLWGGGARPSAYRRLWLFAVGVLSLPAVVFVLLHRFFASLEYFQVALPEWLGTVLYWALAFAGMFGPLCTFGAVSVALAASFVSRMSWTTKFGLWVFVVLSILACGYSSLVIP